MIFESQVWYYVVFMYKYYQLTLFLILMESLTKIQTFSPDWPELGLIKAD